MSLWPLDAQWCISGVDAKRGQRALHPQPLVEFMLPLQLAETVLSETAYSTFRSKLFAFGKAQKAPKGTYLQSISRERYNYSPMFSSLFESGSPSHKNKQTD